MESATRRCIAESSSCSDGARAASASWLAVFPKAAAAPPPVREEPNAPRVIRAAALHEEDRECIASWHRWADLHNSLDIAWHQHRFSDDAATRKKGKKDGLKILGGLLFPPRPKGKAVRPRDLNHKSFYDLVRLLETITQDRVGGSDADRDLRKLAGPRRRDAIEIKYRPLLFSGSASLVDQVFRKSKRTPTIAAEILADHYHSTEKKIREWVKPPGK